MIGAVWFSNFQELKKRDQKGNRKALVQTQYKGEKKNEY